MCRKIFEGAVLGTEVYFAGVGPKAPALSRFPIIKKITGTWRVEITRLSVLERGGF
jgi:hypothetical protein